jgi:hypothetical protein
LKAASKQFKRWKGKRDPIAHVMLPKSFNDEIFLNIVILTVIFYFVDIGKVLNKGTLP